MKRESLSAFKGLPWAFNNNDDKVEIGISMHSQPEPRILTGSLPGLVKSMAWKVPGLRKCVGWIYSRVILRQPSSAFIPSYFVYLRQRPLVFAAWFHLRKTLCQARNKFRRIWSTKTVIEFENKAEKAHLVNRVIPHNINRIGVVGRARTEKLMNVLRSIGELDSKNAKILCVGPRNEAEILLLSLYGFPIKNITGIDLFSYSPLIRVMDMHDMKFPDDQFDIVYSSHVVTYSDDIQRACSEAMRVAKDSGLIAMGFVFGRVNDTLSTRLSGGLKELFGYFGDHIKHIYWQDEVPLGGGATRATTIFRIRKWT